MNLHRVILVALSALLLSGLRTACSDTIFMESGERMEGRILEIEENEEGLQSITIKMRGAIIQVPASMIDRYEDEVEPTETPTFTATRTPIPTKTPVPTVTPTPFPTSTPFVVAPPPVQPVSPPADSGGGGTDTVYEPDNDWPGEMDDEWAADPDMPTDEEWEALFEDEGLGGLNEMLPGDLFPKAMGFILIVFVIRLIAIMGAWVFCTVDAFGHGVVQGILMLVFGCPLCCTCLIPYVGEYISPLILIIYAHSGFRGDTNTIVDVLIFVYIILGWITMWFF
jgi:hypothetical protein